MTTDRSEGDSRPKQQLLILKIPYMLLWLSHDSMKSCTVPGLRDVDAKHSNLWMCVFASDPCWINSRTNPGITHMKKTTLVCEELRRHEDPYGHC